MSLIGNVLKNWQKENQKGSLEAYHTFLKGYDGVDDYRIIPEWDTSGTVKIIVKHVLTDSIVGETVNAQKRNEYLLQTDFLNRLKNELQEKIAVVETSLYLVNPFIVSFNLECTVNITLDKNVIYTRNDAELLRMNLIQDCLAYINGGEASNGEVIKGLGIGEDFIPYKLGVWLSNRYDSIQYVQFNLTEPISIEDENIAQLNDITVLIE